MYSAFLFTSAPPFLDKSPGKTLDLVQRKLWNFFFILLLATLRKFSETILKQMQYDSLELPSF